jgi:sulfide:quinone oxidoreductase
MAMKNLVILGAGTGGTMVANKISEHLDPLEWRIILVDKDETHYYQPGFLFIPFEIYSPRDVVKPKRDFVPPNVEFIISDIEIIEPDKNRVKLAKMEKWLPYDYLVIATGSHVHPEETEGMVNGGWYRNIFDFYTLDGATALSKYLKFWKGGRLVLNIAEMPIKCPVAPLEFLFLADWYFTERGIRDDVELVFATPLDGAFTKPRASGILGDMLDQKNILLETEFNIGEVDAGKDIIRSYDGREIPYDLLVTIPTNMGADVIGLSGMGDELNFVPADRQTLQSNKWENVFVIGDAGNLPTSKAGSVAHFMLEVVVENILRHMEGLELRPDFDGHANCFIESGFEKGILIDFNYYVEPLPGKFPLPGFGPFSLLKESPANHWGKMTFRWVYWNILLKGGEMPFESQMSMAGKWA